MSTSIHHIFQAFKDGVWVTLVDDFQIHRSYWLFSILSGERAEDQTTRGAVIAPISPPRDVPSDLVVEADEQSDGEFFVAYGEGRRSIGQWGFSWLLDFEITQHAEMQNTRLSAKLLELREREKAPIRIVFGYS